MNFKVSGKSIENESLNTLVAFVHSAADKVSEKGHAKSKSKVTKTVTGLKGEKGEIKDFLLNEPSISGKKSEMRLFRNCQVADYKNILSVGLGPISTSDFDDLRVASAGILSHLKAQSITECGIAFETLGNISSKTEVLGHVLAEGFTLSSYNFSEHKKKEDNNDEINEITLLLNNKSKSSGLKRGLDTGKTLAEAVNFARNLGDQPGNKLTPTLLAKATQDAAKGSKLKVTVWDKAAIKKNKMGALLGVSIGSDQDPRFIIMEYKGAAASKKPICYVGKGLTFDSGGISLKPGAGMEEMKYDMCGGANVIGAMLAIARLKLKVNAIAVVPASENMPGPSATKPGDILTAMNGTTIEVNNTDAEGRLILADALCYAVSRKPAVIVDAATLTGAMMIALGSSHTGIYTNSPKLMQKINSAAERAGESVWQMPLSEDHSNDMKGTYADLSNLGPSREAGSATAAAFLKHFVDDVPWAHFDIAGTAWHNGKRKAYHPKKGASGIMVRTFVELSKAY